MTRVLALDPGERVGWAHGTISPVGLEVTGHGISVLKDMALAVHARASEYDVLIYETWRLRPAMAKKFAGNDFPSVQFIGMVRLAAWLTPGLKLVSQGPSIKATADRVIPAHYSDIAEKIAALPKAHDDSHDGDALRHLAYYHFDRYLGKDPA